jgi:hypothetical protein
MALDFVTIEPQHDDSISVPEIAHSTQLHHLRIMRATKVHASADPQVLIHTVDIGSPRPIFGLACSQLLARDVLPDS